jgi:hypothetical protein
MVKRQIPLGDNTYQSTVSAFSAQRCVNMYVVVAQARAINQVALFGTPGITLFTTNSEQLEFVGGVSRGAVVIKNAYYVVIGSILYEVLSSGQALVRGEISGDKRVSMAHNGEKLCIVVPGGTGYEYNTTTRVLTPITSVNYRIADTVCFKDGYFIFTATAGDVFFNSALNDPLTFDALDFGTKEFSPDPIVSCHVNYDEVFVIGSQTTGIYQNIYQNVGGAGFPFQLISGATYEKGTHSKYSPIQWEGAFYFVGGGINEKSSIFRAGSTGEPVRVSTDAIDQEIQKFTPEEISESFSFTYSTDGFSFVGFTFQSIVIPSRTFVFNVTASQLLKTFIWFEQQTGLSDNAWRVSSVNYVYGKFMVSDITNSYIGYLDSNVYTEYLKVILREKVTGPISDIEGAIIVNEIELTMNSGSGGISGQEQYPKVMLDYSDDGAKTWSSEFLMTIGSIGEYFIRVVRRRLGRIPVARHWRFRVTDPVKVAFLRLVMKLTGGN